MFYAQSFTATSRHCCDDKTLKVVLNPNIQTKLFMTYMLFEDMF